MNGKIFKYKDRQGYGWVADVDGKQYWFHINDLADRAQKELVELGREVTFEVQSPEPENGSAVGKRTLRILEHDAPNASVAQSSVQSSPTPPVVAPVVSKIPNAKDDLPPFSFTHKVLPGMVMLIVDLGRANDGVSLCVNNKIYNLGLKPKKGEEVPFTLTDKNGKAEFPVELTEEQETKGFLPMSVVLERQGCYNVSWVREHVSTPASYVVTRQVKPVPSVSKPAVPPEEPNWDPKELEESLRRQTATIKSSDLEPGNRTEKDFVDFLSQSETLSVKDITPEGEHAFMTVEIAYTGDAPVSTKLIFSGRKKSEWAVQMPGQDWKIGRELQFEIDGEIICNVRINQLASGEYGGDHLVVTSDSGKTVNIYIPAAFVVKPTGGNESQKERVH